MILPSLVSDAVTDHCASWAAAPSMSAFLVVLQTVWFVCQAGQGDGGLVVSSVRGGRREISSHGYHVSQAVWQS